MPLKLVRRKNSINWYLRGTVAGVTVDESTRLADRTAAEAIKARREWELTQEAVFGRRAVSTFLEAAVGYLEQGGQTRFLARVINHFGATPLSKINQAAIEHAAHVLYPTAKPGTLNRQLYTPISCVLRYAAKRGLCEYRVIERPRQPKGRVRWITPAEAHRLVESCAPHLKPLVTFLLYTGARMSEALYLDWRDVDLARAHVTFPETKNGDARGVPLHPAAVTALANLPHCEGPVFRRPDSRPYARPRQLGGGQIKKAFAAACRRAGLAEIVGYTVTDGGQKTPLYKATLTPHDLRHTWATWHYAANRDLAGLMKLAGWRSERMALRYAHLNVENLAASIAALPSMEPLQEPKHATKEAASEGTGKVAHLRHRV